MKKEIWFDMDGTIADLYGVDKWLEKILDNDVSPYENAKPLINMNILARILNKLQKQGYKIGIVSWLAYGENIDGEKIENAKRNGLKSIYILSTLIILISCLMERRNKTGETGFCSTMRNATAKCGMMFRMMWIISSEC